MNGFEAFLTAAALAALLLPDARAQEPSRPERTEADTIFISPPPGTPFFDVARAVEWSRSAGFQNIYFGAVPADLEIAFEFRLDGESWRVEADGDQVELRIDGDEAPEGRYRVDAAQRRYTLLAPDGTELGWISLGHDGAAVRFNRHAMQAWLGLDLQPVDPALATHLGLDATQVAQVVAVRPDSPAAEAGLRQHDIITRFAGESPVTEESVRKAIAERRPGDQVTIDILRRGSEEEVEVTLGRAPVSAFDWRALHGGEPSLLSGVIENDRFSFDLYRALQGKPSTPSSKPPEQSGSGTREHPYYLWQGTWQTAPKPADEEAKDLAKQIEALRAEIEAMRAAIEKARGDQRDERVR